MLRLNASHLDDDDVFGLIKIIWHLNILFLIVQLVFVFSGVSMPLEMP